VQFTGISFVDSQTGWLVGNGDDGIYTFQTQNGGIKWIPISIFKEDFSYESLDVGFISGMNGWMVGKTSNEYGNGGFLLYTDSGGRRWKSISTGVNRPLTDIHFSGDDKGWIVGYEGTILNTDNGMESDISTNFYDNAVVLGQSPNPFSAFTEIDYELGNPSWVQLSVYNQQGALVDVIVDDFHLQGKYRAPWAVPDLPPGIYFCVLKTNWDIRTSKMIKLD